MKKTSPIIKLKTVVREIPADLDTPVSIFLRIKGQGPSFMLESITGGEQLARYSVIGVRPRLVVRAGRRARRPPPP